jgi:hypothetical protein
MNTTVYIRSYNLSKVFITILCCKSPEFENKKMKLLCKLTEDMYKVYIHVPGIQWKATLQTCSILLYILRVHSKIKTKLRESLIILQCIPLRLHNGRNSNLKVTLNKQVMLFADC